MLLCIFFLATFSLQHSFAAENSGTLEGKRILLIAGYTDLGPWEQKFNNTLVRLLSSEMGAEVTPEFLPLIEFAGDEQTIQQLALSMRTRYTDLQRSYHLVIAIQPEATEFLATWGETLFSNTEFLYVLPSATLVERLSQDGEENIILSATPTAIHNTIRLIPRLLPSLESVIVVGGSGAGDLSYIQRTRNAYRDFDSDANIIYITGLSLERLTTRLREENTNSAILLPTYNRDSDGNVLRTIDVSSAIAQDVELPLFTIFEDLIGRGAIGGNVTGSIHYAEQTALFSEAIINNFPYQARQETVSSYQFDAKQLERFGISHRSLPEQSLLINYEAPAWRTYIWQIVIALSIITTLLILLALLYRSIRLRAVAEKELREAQKLEALGIFSSGIAHDFNNILMAIDGNAEVAKESIKASPAIAEKCLSSVSMAVDRAKHLISQILLFSRPSNNEVYRTISPAKLLEECVDMAQASAPQSIHFSSTIAKDLWFIVGSETKLQQVIINLLSNSRDAIEGEGKVELIAENIVLRKRCQFTGGALEAGKYISISVIDTGSGISEEIISRVFEPFFTTKAMRKGTGLGLSIVHGIVRELKGTLDIKSKLNQGTTVSLLLPADFSAVKPIQDKQESHGARGAGQHILLVDDDEMVLASSKAILGRLGYTVTACDHPFKAIEAFSQKTNRFDLLFCDFSMPDMNGTELIAQLRSKGFSAPVVLCTGNSSAINQESADNPYDFTLLTKPCTSTQISETISAALRGEEPVKTTRPEA
ncbi:MAG: ATP-binding protein [Pseudohongiellaceae bacterium]|nr:ATP-binding protein [Pseudohongiellaceae bacterium]